MADANITSADDLPLGQQGPKTDAVLMLAAVHDARPPCPVRRPARALGPLIVAKLRTNRPVDSHLESRLVWGESVATLKNLVNTDLVATG